MIEYREISKGYGDHTVLSNISFEVQPGELMVLIGPSGCGKSTLLKLTNRMIEPTSGAVFLQGQDTRTLDPVDLRRRMGYVIQSIGLFPHMTVFENVEVVPSILRVPQAQRRKRAEELLSMVGLDPALYGPRSPRALSGGQQQRVGIARALAADPEILLMDEPFSAVDPLTRLQLQEEFLRIKQTIHKTILFVTHDLEEAMKLGDRVCLLNGGHIEQVGTPREVLGQPATPFVRAFVGEDRSLKQLAHLQVKDRMQHTPAPENLPAIAAEATVRQALVAFLDHATEVLRVTDGSGQTVGRLSLSDLVQERA